MDTLVFCKDIDSWFIVTQTLEASSSSSLPPSAQVNSAPVTFAN